MPRKCRTKRRVHTRGLRNGQFSSTKNTEEQCVEKEVIEKLDKNLIKIIKAPDLKRNIKEQGDRQIDLRNYKESVIRRIEELVPFSTCQTNPRNEFIKNPALTNPTNYYELIKMNDNVTGYGSSNTFPPKEAAVWTVLEQQLFIDPLMKNVANIKDVVPFSLQIIYYNTNENLDITNMKRKRSIDSISKVVPVDLSDRSLKEVT